jgi:DNA-binding Lrp family transcriptional regulator
MLDKKDQLILNVLKNKSNLSVKQISKLTKIPATTVYNRIKNLENEKIIKSYGINLDFDKLGYDIKVIIQVRISKGKLFEVEKAVSKSENVYAVYDLTGDFDALIVARFKSRQSLDNFLKKLQSYDFVQRTHTSFVLNTIKE